MMLGGFSHSTGVGKLWQELLDVHSDVCFKFSWYTVDEEETVCNYYLRYFHIKVLSSDSFSISWHGHQSHVLPAILWYILHLLMPEMIYKKSRHLCCSITFTHYNCVMSYGTPRSKLLPSQISEIFSLH
uniref:Uncharacterized protein n=1 Tax=Aegilops tauschii subsp. strangulata TaxID=200361 RepID=A0A453AGP3_AEGTS